MPANTKSVTRPGPGVLKTVRPVLYGLPYGAFTSGNEFVSLESLRPESQAKR